MVYEIAEKRISYLVRPNQQVLDYSVDVNEVVIRELANRDTIHLYDAKANSSKEPAIAFAFRIITSSRNSKNFEQNVRSGKMYKYCIPSYTVEELVEVCDQYGVSPEETRRRCDEIGPSIRHILVQDYENQSKKSVGNKG